jgi:hypothetical protein
MGQKLLRKGLTWRGKVPENLGNILVQDTKYGRNFKKLFQSLIKRRYPVNATFRRSFPCFFTR